VNPLTTLAIIVFTLGALLQLLRVPLQRKVAVNGTLIPLLASEPLAWSRLHE
jgi:hypothetical protein